MPVANIVILSEDRLFSSLVVRNLEAQGHEANIYLLNRQRPLSFLASPSTSDVFLWVMDLAWFEESREPIYAKLADWCTHLYQPSILLLDTSWEYSHVQAFNATAILTKPFGMDRLLDMVQQLCDKPTPE